VSSPVNVLGVGISPINMREALDRIDGWITRREPHYVCVCTVHTVMQCRRSERLRSVVNASGMNTPDGMPLVWLSRMAGNAGVSRVYGPDLMLAVMERSKQAGYRHFFYGGRPGVVERLRERFAQRFPWVQVVGSLTPPFASVEGLATQEAAALIDQTRPDLVWVGISTPKQELWMSLMRSRLSAPVLIGVGAAFDFHAGSVAQAPRWMQQAGLEWFFRLLREPRRLWRRYLVDNPWFLFELLRQKLGLKRYQIS
jgi:N-acetylglucosaminyldiphosphoundecaprenol N-acetyl-beta-D-mannosaminyltransferase